MDISEKISRLPNETDDEYCQRWYLLRDTLGLTWMELAEIINEELGYSYSPDRYRKASRRLELSSIANIQYDDMDCNSDVEGLNELKLERIKLADERTQINALYRRIAREESLKEIAKEACEHMDKQFKLAPKSAVKKISDKDGILEISDWHYGIEIDNYWNTYNPDIAQARIAKLRDEVLDICDREGLTHLNVVNLGDLIAGRIHLPLRINSRFDVVTQTIQVSELLAQMLCDLSEKVSVDYYDTLDNHSRLEPNLKESMDLESLARITTWYLKSRTPFITIHDNEFGDDIITFETLGHKVVGVHGHRDKPTKIIDNMTTMTHQHYDIALTAHLHHFSCEEKNETVLVSNSSMMGTDEFAEKLRLSAKPSQNLIIVTKDNPVHTIYKINLD